MGSNVFVSLSRAGSISGVRAFSSAFHSGMEYNWGKSRLTMKKEKNIEKVVNNPQWRNMIAIERRRMQGRKKIQLQVTNIGHSPRKMEDILKLIRRMDVVEAQAQLKFLNKLHSHTVLRILNDMVAKATKDYGLAAEDLFVDLAFPTKGRVLKRIKYHAKGRAGLMQRRSCHVNMTLMQKERTPLEEMEPVDESSLSEQERHDFEREKKLDQFLKPLKFRQKLTRKEILHKRRLANQDEFYPEGTSIDSSGMRI